jgi:hypothetical protein
VYALQTSFNRGAGKYPGNDLAERIRPEDRQSHWPAFVIRFPGNLEKQTGGTESIYPQACPGKSAWPSKASWPDKKTSKKSGALGIRGIAS